MLSVSRVLLAGGALLVSLGAAACGVATDVQSDGRQAAAIALDSGVDLQTANVGSSLPTLASVTVRDQFGAPLPNAVVLWNIRSGGGSLALTSTLTDTSGRASTSWILGRTAGTQTLAVAIATGDSVLITATAKALSPTTFEVMDGDNQELVVGQVSSPFVVRALDLYLNAVPGEPVAWESSSGVLSADTTFTDAAGLATVQLTAPADRETVAVIARLRSGASLAFQLRIRS